MIELKRTISFLVISEKLRAKNRYTVPTFPISTNPIVRYADVATRRFNPLDRARDGANPETSLDQALTTESGLQAIAGAMVAPLQATLNYNSVARQIFQVYRLQYGEMAVFDTDLPENSGRMNVQTTPLVARIAISYSNLEIRRFDVLNLARNRAEAEIRELEDRAAVTALVESTQNRPPAPNFESAFGELMDQRLVPGSILVHPINLQGLMTNIQNYSAPPILGEGTRFGTYLGANVFVSTEVPQTTSFLLTPPNYAGVLAERTPLQARMEDDPGNLLYYLNLWENIGIAVLNPNRVVPIYVEAR